jgi:eukaryotic-like serine/threonine-protein kinase
MLPAGTMLKTRYRIEGPLGRGGMGSVYLARDTTFGSEVAVKQMTVPDATLRSAFRREAKILNRLRHPAIPVVLDYFAEDSGDFLVMQYVAGEDLGVMLHRRPAPFPADIVLDWGDQLLDALVYLHTSRPPIIHRDIKPHNLKLSPDRKVILLDFGLSKLAGDDSAISNASMSLRGFSQRFAPLEQILNLGTDARSDLYSLGATLHYLMTKQKPIESVRREACVVRGREDPLEPLHACVPEVSREVSDVLSRALETRAENRYETAAKRP